MDTVTRTAYLEIRCHEIELECDLTVKDGEVLVVKVNNPEALLPMLTDRFSDDFESIDDELKARDLSRSLELEGDYRREHGDR